VISLAASPGAGPFFMPTNTAINFKTRRVPGINIVMAETEGINLSKQQFFQPDAAALP
jgi:hypothetical protein